MVFDPAPVKGVSHALPIHHNSRMTLGSYSAESPRASMIVEIQGITVSNCSVPADARADALQAIDVNPSRAKAREHEMPCESRRDSCISGEGR